MKPYPMTDQAICKEIGRRIKKLRLRKNVTQQEIAHRTLLSPGTIVSLEKGNGKIATMVAVLRELGALDAVDAFLPDPGISPIELAKRKGKTRHRASGRHGQSTENEDVDW